MNIIAVDDEMLVLKQADSFFSGIFCMKNFIDNRNH